MLTGFIIGFLAASILWLIVWPWWVSRSHSYAKRLDNDFIDDSWEKLNARLNHPTSRVP